MGVTMLETEPDTSLLDDRCPQMAYVQPRARSEWARRRALRKCLPVLQTPCVCVYETCLVAVS